MSRCIASVSWGKDSLAMLILLIERGWPLDEVVFYDTGMEFEAVYNERDRMLPVLASMGVEYTELKPREPFLHKMFVHPVRSRETGEVHKYGYGWYGGACRWGTTEKTAALDRYAERKNAIVYVGIAADEERRLAKRRKPYKRFPLADRGLTEADCLELCRAHGATWEQDGVCLYDVLDREALLALADELEEDACWEVQTPGDASGAWRSKDACDRIREACGVER